MELKNISLEISDSVALLTLNDPGTLNAVSMDMLDELNEAFDSIEDSANGVRCLVMTGAGKGFCSGANLAGGGVADGEDGKPDFGAVLENYYHPLLLRMRALPIPFVTAVNGAAAGIGMSFALMGDMILASRKAYFLQAFRRIGLVPDGGSTWLLPRLVGLTRAKELSLMAEKLHAEKALDWGLINRVYEPEDLMQEAMTLARDLAEGPTVAYGLMRQLFASSPDTAYEEQLKLERNAQKQAGYSEDCNEGISAFLERRPAKFTGR